MGDIKNALKRLVEKQKEFELTIKERVIVPTNHDKKSLPEKAEEITKPP